MPRISPVLRRMRDGVSDRVHLGDTKYTMSAGAQSKRCAARSEGVMALNRRAIEKAADDEPSFAVKRWNIAYVPPLDSEAHRHTPYRSNGVDDEPSDKPKRRRFDVPDLLQAPVLYRHWLASCHLV
ncbi:hypothetical protein MTO96_010337 [Rhipicephalus appendiculatus]